ncbi:hypothetical protein [Chitinimonas lacunae]|uniref:Uncharacterized protein n=1 Tax=Chitinimonas lacunae TaxID=1963018 RepID=A0ABV8MT64_9NEIS
MSSLCLIPSLYWATTLSATLAMVDEHQRRVVLPPAQEIRRPVLNLDLPRSPPSHLSAVAALSPILQGPAGPAARPPSLRPDPEREAAERLARVIESTEIAERERGTLCLSRSGNSPGAGLRWSSNDGFGFYLQGKGLRQLHRLLYRSSTARLCPSGNASPLCQTLPRRLCD